MHNFLQTLGNDGVQIWGKELCGDGRRKPKCCRHATPLLPRPHASRGMQTRHKSRSLFCCCCACNCEVQQSATKGRHGWRRAKRNEIAVVPPHRPAVPPHCAPRVKACARCHRNLDVEAKGSMFKAGAEAPGLVAGGPSRRPVGPQQREQAPCSTCTDPPCLRLLRLATQCTEPPQPVRFFFCLRGVTQAPLHVAGTAGTAC
jgi:hypothetical protein